MMRTITVIVTLDGTMWDLKTALKQQTGNAALAAPQLLRTESVVRMEAHRWSWKRAESYRSKTSLQL